MNKLALFGFAFACGMAAATSAQAVVIGTADSAGSYPFGSSGGGYYFQQVYSAASFGTPITISNLTFYTTQSPTTVTPLNDTFTIYLSVTSAAVPTFDTSAFAFPDASFTTAYTGKVTVVGGKLVIALTTPFTYNPTAGNLMLTVKDFDLGSGGNLFLDVDKNVGVTNMRISAFAYDFNQGLVTGFNEAAAIAVPEPATWGMMILGFGMVGGTLRYRRRSMRVAFA